MGHRGDVSQKHVKAPSLLVLPTQENAHNHNNVLGRENSAKWLAQSW